MRNGSIVMLQAFAEQSALGLVVPAMKPNPIVVASFPWQVRGSLMCGSISSDGKAHSNAPQADCHQHEKRDDLHRSVLTS